MNPKALWPALVILAAAIGLISLDKPQVPIAPSAKPLLVGPPAPATSKQIAQLAQCWGTNGITDWSRSNIQALIIQHCYRPPRVFIISFTSDYGDTSTAYYLQTTTNGYGWWDIASALSAKGETITWTNPILWPDQQFRVRVGVGIK